MKKWTRVMYQPNLPLEAGRYVTASKEHIALSLEAATEGMVLLKNENNILPLKNVPGSHCSDAEALIMSKAAAEAVM